MPIRKCYLLSERQEITNVGRVGKKQNPSALLVGMQTGAAIIIESSMEFHEKIKHRIIWSSNPTSKYTFKGNENRISKRYLHFPVYSSIIHNSQDMETTQMPINRCMVKKDVMYIHNRTLLGHQKKGYLAICSKWMDLKHIRLSEMNQRKMNIFYYYLNVESKKSPTC